MNWKEQLRQAIPDSSNSNKIYYDIEPIITEIIEKLIADIPDETSLDLRNHPPEGAWLSVSTKQRLRDKWL